MATQLGKTYQEKTTVNIFLTHQTPILVLLKKQNMKRCSDSDDGGQNCQEKHNIIPGLYKLFDEGIVNCRDHVKNGGSQESKGAIHSYIDISIAEDGVITMINDGNGIDVAKHPEYNIWIPEMIFGHLRTSTNYDKDEREIVGGKNGFGLNWFLFGLIGQY